MVKQLTEDFAKRKDTGLSSEKSTKSFLAGKLGKLESRKVLAASTDSHLRMLETPQNPESDHDFLNR